MKNFYHILGVDSNTSREEIKIAYKKLAIKFHPDKNFGDIYFEERFKEIQNAYDTLIDEKLRNEYNKKLSHFRQNQASYSGENFHKPSEQKSNGKSKTKTKTTRKYKNWFKWNLTKIESVILILLLTSLIVAYTLESWFGVIIILALFLSIGGFISTVKDPFANRRGGHLLIGLFGAPIFAVYLLMQIYTYLFPSNVDKEYKPTIINIMTSDSNNFVQFSNGSTPLDNCFGSGVFEGHARVIFQNQAQSDAIYCLVNKDTKKTIRNEYIQAGTTHTMYSIPAGIYYLKIYYGKDWNRNKSNNCDLLGSFNFDEEYFKLERDFIFKKVSKSNYGYGFFGFGHVTNGLDGWESIDATEFYDQK